MYFTYLFVLLLLEWRLKGTRVYLSVLLTDISPVLNKDLVHGRYSINICQIRDFLGGPVVKTSCCQYRGTGLILDQGTKIPHAVGHS